MHRSEWQTNEQQKNVSDSKWISGLTGSMPALAAARKVLEARLAAVRDRLEPAVHYSEKDVEHVHQLRVSTRRAGAALRIFASLLPEKLHRQVRKRLRQSRRAAGDARDWDVFREHVMEFLAAAAPRQTPGLDFLVGLAEGRRLVAQTVLIDAAHGSEAKLIRSVTDVAAGLAEPDRTKPIGTFRGLAGTTLGAFLTEFHDCASKDLHDYDQLHRVRIAGKRLRYAMEVFASCYPTSFRDEIYPVVEGMQEILGLANDSHVAAGRLLAIRERLQKVAPRAWRRYKAGVDGLLKRHQLRLLKQRQLFLKWKKDWLATGMEAEFIRLVGS